MQSVRQLVPAVVGALALAVAVPVLATGFGGSDSPGARIPIPARDFAAVVEDQSGIRIEVTQATYNGEVHLYGFMGEGQVTIPFEKIAEVRFEPSQAEGKLVAFVKLKDGSSVSVLVEDDTPAYGKTSFGTYTITVDKIRRIEIVGPVAPVAP